MTNIPDQIEAGGSSWRSLALSLTIHATLLICFAIFWNTGRPFGFDEPPRRVSLVLTNSDSQPAYLDESDLLDAQPEEPTESVESALPADQPPPIDVTPLVSAQSPIELPLPGLDVAEMTNVPDSLAQDSQSIRITPEQQRMLDAERAAFEARRPKGPATTIRVFNSGELTGHKFVFVIDRSKSMGGQGLNVLVAAVAELTGAIDQLEPYHQFQLIAYHDRTITIEQRALLPATIENKQRVGDFIRGLAAYGGTEHEGALMVALSMNPDVIVLMTDGGLPDLNQGQLKRIRQAADGAQIHCVQFGSGPQQDRNSFMRLLAAQNNGSYRYVDVDKWNLDDN